MKLTVDDVKLARKDQDEREVQTGRYGSRRTVKLKAYDVFAPDGDLIGVVYQDMHTFERRTPGRVYVNSRWQSPRWFQYLGTDRYGYGHRRLDHETRKWALEDLLRAYAQIKEASDA